MVLPALLALALPSAPLAGGPAACPQGEGLTLVRIQGELDVGTQALVKRAIDRARERKERLVLELDTPGGQVELMWQIANAIVDAPDSGVGTVAWVHDRALSAGALLALACERIYMRSHATIGSALPVSIGPTGLEPVSEDEDVREKITSHLRGEFRGIAEKRGRPGVLAEAMVDPDVEVLKVYDEGEVRLVSGQELDDIRNLGRQPDVLDTIVARGQLLNATGSEAVELELADGLAESMEELAAKLGVAGVSPSEVHRSRSEDLAAWLYRLSPLLLLAAFVCLYLELKTPGFGLAGTLALASLGIVLFGRYLVGLADVPHVLLITGGAALIAVELFLVPGTIWPGALGAVAILVGLVWSFVGARIGFEYGLDRAILIEESFRVVGAGFLALLVILGLSRALPHVPVLSRLVLGGSAGTRDVASPGTRPVAAGELGRALTALRPVGKVQLDALPGIEFEGRAEGPEISAGARVRVIEVQGSERLVVAREERA